MWYSVDDNERAGDEDESEHNGDENNDSDNSFSSEHQ